MSAESEPTDTGHLPGGLGAEATDAGRWLAPAGGEGRPRDARFGTLLSVHDLEPRSRLGRMAEDVLRFGRKGFARIAEFTPARLNLSWITDQLAAGGAFRTADIPRLQRLGIRAVVDCREEASDDQAALGRHGIAFLHLPTPDVHQLSQPALDEGVAWANAWLDRGEKVFVHCLHGVGRGPLLGCCILVARGLTAPEALKTMKTRRWQASPNEEQLGALLEFAQRYSTRSAELPGRHPWDARPAGGRSSD